MEHLHEETLNVIFTGNRGGDVPPSELEAKVEEGGNMDQRGGKDELDELDDVLEHLGVLHLGAEEEGEEKEEKEALDGGLTGLIIKEQFERIIECVGEDMLKDPDKTPHDILSFLESHLEASDNKINSLEFVIKEHEETEAEAHLGGCLQANDELAQQGTG
jgi:hypothetical protein